MTEPAPRALLVDLDGTLADTLGDFVAALHAVADELGLVRPEPPWVRAHIGRGGQRLINDWLAAQGRGAAEFSNAWAAYQRHYAAVNGRHARLYPGAAATLLGLAQGSLRLACVTNKPQAQAEALLALLGVRGHFAVVVGQGPGLRPKPQPDALLAACQALGLQAADCWAVGDSRNDAEAALAAGCAAVLLLRHGYNHGEPVDAVPARAHLDCWEQLPALLQRRA